MRLACCIPGGSLMPEGVASVPRSPVEQIAEKCQYLLKIGFDCTELAGGMLASLQDAEVEQLVQADQTEPLRLVAVNSLFPGDYRLADPAADKAPYLARAVRIFDIMQKLGISYAVFGSGGARSLREEYGSLEESRQTLYAFLRALADEAGKRDITVLLEPLRKQESNIFVTVPESAAAVRELHHPRIRLLCDAFHMAEEGTDPSCIRDCADLVCHCHVSEAPKRNYCGAEDCADPTYLRRFAEALRDGGYEGTVSMECGFGSFAEESKRGLAAMQRIFLREAVCTYRAVRRLREEPIFLRPAEGELPRNIIAMSCGERSFPATVLEDGVVVLLTAERGETLTLHPICGEADNVCVTCRPEAYRTDVCVGGFPFASYRFDPAVYKPFFGPVFDQDGHSFTREAIHHEEHPHQRSVFVAIGDVNGVDCWNEYGNYGYVRTESVSRAASGAAYGTFTVQNRWEDQQQKPLLRETTCYKIYNQSEACRTVDLTITLTALYGEVRFGKTKEAGPLGIRLRDELRSDIGSGQLSNSWGGVGEAECWGRAAEWCDYAGNVEGIGPMGVTVFDADTNERYPTAWHIRGYGLFAANNLYFKGGYTLPAGESVTYRYRILFRRAPLSRDELADKYVVYTLGEKH